MNYKAKSNGKHFSTYLKNSNTNNFFIKPMEVINIIYNLSNNKATGTHSIPTNILHLIKLSVAQPLADITNLSFEKGTYMET